MSGSPAGSTAPMVAPETPARSDRRHERVEKTLAEPITATSVHAEASTPELRYLSNSEETASAPILWEWTCDRP
jgi:hypothetical protein